MIRRTRHSLGKSCVVGSLALVCLLSVGLISSAAARKPQIEPARLLGIAETAGRTVKIAVEFGSCAAEPSPHIAHLKVSEHPRSGRWPVGYVLVEVFVAFERPAEPPVTCAPLGGTLYARVRLRRPTRT